ncbi:MAG: permease-like cell division protein FtsX [Lachnospiraceae bacterium]|nr:permease-like cell division protein FtsX [Lachnospiraceae bacterium]MEE3433351.1 permease-like cell division protein FtsX [Lachnospiraceae bacterium]
MKFSTFTYCLNQGIRNIWRNKMFSLASIATMSACIFLFGIFYSLGVNFSNMVKEAEESVAVTVFFNEGTPEERIQEIGEEIKSRPEVAECTYVSADEAWNTFKETYFKGHEEAAESYGADNPLAQSSNYQIYLNDISEQESLVKYLGTIEDIRQVNQSETAANTLSDFNRLITLISIAIVTILIAVAIFLISNTITVGISVRKDEIAIMKLIGAKDSFVRAPFVVEGVVIGLIGTVIPLGILWYLYGSIIRYVAEKFRFLSNILNFVPEQQVFRVLVPVALLLGLGIGYVGSKFTLRRHLKV